MEVVDGQGESSVHRGGGKTSDVAPEGISRLQIPTKEEAKVWRIRAGRKQHCQPDEQDKTRKGRERAWRGLQRTVYEEANSQSNVP